MTQNLMQPRFFHRRHTEGRSYWGPGDIYTFLVTGEESGGAYFSMLAIVPPQGGPPPHIHLNVAGPGDFVNVPKGVVHCFRNVSNKPLRMILTFTPAGIEKFFEETLERCNDVTLPCPDNLAEVGARFAEAAPRYGITFFAEA